MTKTQAKEYAAALAALDKAARQWRRWVDSRATADNELRFVRANRRLHKAVERYALSLPKEEPGG